LHVTRSFFLSTLGCAKNDVDSAKLAGRLRSQGYEEALRPGEADLVVVNTCAFIEPARAESIDTILQMSELRRPGARLAVTGCLAERHGEELAEVLGEVDVVAGFGMDFTLPAELEEGAAKDAPPGTGLTPSPVLLRARGDIPTFDLLELPRPPATAPWAYVKAAEGCDRRCGFCAIPSFRGRQRSRSIQSIIAEIDALEVSEVVLVAQDLASYGRDQARRPTASGAGEAGIIELVEAAAERVARLRLLYLYPSSLADPLIEAVCATGVPYFDLSLQHASARLLRRMRRWGSAERFLERINRIRTLAPGAALRSSFILGYPGETEEDHDELLAFIEEAELDWGGFFEFSPESGTYAAGLQDQVPAELATERLRECSELQDAITSRRRRELVGSTVSVLVDEAGHGRSYREAPEIDGVVQLPPHLVPGAILDVVVTAAVGPDLEAVPVPATPVTKLPPRQDHER
jgi:ribosomal protein S12 methylthiotransferase